jgi:pseudouridine kinase
MKFSPAPEPCQTDLDLSLEIMHKPVVCIGAALIDELFHTGEPILASTTNNATVTRTPGGVARNIAHQLSLLGVPVELISVFGNDGDGDWLKSQCLDAGIGLSASLTPELPTGKYTGILRHDGSLYTAFLTAGATHLITPDHLEQHRELLLSASHILACANVEREAIKWILSFSKETGIPFIIEPVSVPPASKLADIDLDGLYLITPNEDELPVLCKGSYSSVRDYVDELLSRGVRQVWLHNGARGSSIFSREKDISLHACKIQVADCTGAGDGSLSGFLLGKHLRLGDEECLRVAHTLAAEILQVDGANVPNLNRKKLLEIVHSYYP